jgi:hypothetical protein
MIDFVIWSFVITLTPIGFFAGFKAFATLWRLIDETFHPSPVIPQKRRLASRPLTYRSGHWGAYGHGR